VLNGFNLTEVVAVRVVSYSRFVGFVIGPGCAVQDLKGCFFGFRWKAVHSDDIVGIVVSVCCWVENSVLSSSELGRGCFKSCVFNCPVRFPDG
jgi:hypothetical protein